jgi:AcrR family transcriptional regulator
MLRERVRTSHCRHGRAATQDRTPRKSYRSAPAHPRAGPETDRPALGRARSGGGIEAHALRGRLTRRRVERNGVVGHDCVRLRSCGQVGAFRLVAGNHDEAARHRARGRMHGGRNFHVRGAARKLTFAKQQARRVGDTVAGVESADALVHLSEKRAVLGGVGNFRPSVLGGSQYRQTGLYTQPETALEFPHMAVAAPTKQDARGRILETAYELFSRRGVRDVGVDEVVARAGVAKATLYRHFPSKDELVLAFLAQREQVWTRGIVEAGARRRGKTPEERLLAIFDVFDGWFRQSDFEACSFINVLLEMNARHPAGEASVGYLENIRAIVRTLAEEAELEDTDAFARSWHILMKGSIISAAEGDTEAAQRAKAMAAMLIERHRAAPPAAA